MNTAIKRLRGDESQQVFATRMGISISALQNYERESKPRRPPLPLLVTLTKEARSTTHGRRLANTFWKAFLRDSGIGGQLNYFGFSDLEKGTLESYLFWFAGPDSDVRERDAQNAILNVLIAAAQSPPGSEARERAMRVFAKVTDLIREAGSLAQEETGAKDK